MNMMGIFKVRKKAMANDNGIVKSEETV